MSQSKISFFELGHRVPTAEEIGQIASALEYDAEFFYLSEPVHAVGASLLYRQKAAVPVKDQRQAEAEINVRKIQISRMLRSCSLGEHNFPSIPAEELDGNPGAVAREVRKMWKIPQGPIRDLTAVVEEMGGIVVHMDFHSRSIDGAHLWVPGLPPMFFMNKAVPGERYRFSLAHEIGHAVMHRAVGMGEIETEANIFASEFLMPRIEIRSDLRGFNLETARRLKPFWKVSMQALITRAKDLDLITKAAANQLWQKISSRGMRVAEPWPLPMETATTLDRLYEFHYSQLGLSAAELRRLLFAEFGPLRQFHAPEMRLRRVDDDLLATPQEDDSDDEESSSCCRFPTAPSLRVVGGPAEGTQ